MFVPSVRYCWDGWVITGKAAWRGLLGWLSSCQLWAGAVQPPCLIAAVLCVGQNSCGSKIKRNTFLVSLSFCFVYFFKFPPEKQSAGIISSKSPFPVHACEFPISNRTDIPAPMWMLQMSLSTLLSEAGFPKGWQSLARVGCRCPSAPWEAMPLCVWAVAGTMAVSCFP